MIVKLTLDIYGPEFKQWLKDIDLEMDDAEDDPSVLLDFMNYDILPWVTGIQFQ